MDAIQGNHFKDFLDVLFKRKILILLFLFATVITAVIGVSFFQEVEYEAHSKILIETNRGFVSDLSLPIDGARRHEGGTNLDQQVDLALQVLNGNYLAHGVANKVGPTVIYEDLADLSPGMRKQLLIALGWENAVDHHDMPIAEIAALRLQDSIITHRAGNYSSIINISFRHEDPAIAAEVVNAVDDLFLEHNLQLRKKPRLSKFFQEEFDVKKEKLATAEQNIKAFKEKHGITSTLEEHISLIMEQRVTHQTLLDEAASQEAELRDKYRQLNNQLAVTADPEVVNTLRDKLFDLQIKEDRLASQRDADVSDIENIRKEIQGVRNKLDELGYEKPVTLNNEDESLYAGLQSKTQQAKMNANTIKARNAAMRSNLARYDNQLRKLDSLEEEFNHLQEELSIAQNSFRLYQMKFEEFRISDALDAVGIGNVKVLEPARVPLSPIPPKTALILLLSLFFGSLGGIGLALMLELLSGTLSKKEDTEHYLKRPVLATIPEYDTGTVPQLLDRRSSI